MISITCTSCRQTLEMDEAFAGGVCRCQFCGTIQTVPSHLKAKAAAAAAAGVGHGSAKSLYQSAAGAGAPSSGLDDLASAVTSSGLSSSGLSGSGLRSRGAATQAARLDYQRPQPAASGSSKGLIIALGAGVIVVLLAVIGYLVLGTSTTVVTPIANPGTGTPTGVKSTVNPPVNTSANPTHVATPSAVTGPNFCGVALAGNRIVYVIDCGNSSERFFDPLKVALQQSIKSLGADKEYQVIFWKRSSDASIKELSFPSTGVAKATPANGDAFIDQSANVNASGSTRIDEAIQEAVSRSPSTIVVATGKSDLTMEGTDDAVFKARGSTNVKVHAISLGGAGASTILKNIATRTGGTYAEVTTQQLQDQ